METTSCSELRTSLIRKLNDEVETSIIAGQCVFTIPIRSLDDRYIEVFVERKLGDQYRVHDAGITTSHLFAQGVHITERKSGLFEELARRLGVLYVRGSFEISCRKELVDGAILAIGQCASIATFELAEHVPVVERESVKQRVFRSLEQSRRDYVQSIGTNIAVKGRKTRHTFDFVRFSNEPRFNTVAVQVLSPSNSPQAQAERYGFLVLDSEDVPPYNTWKRLAVVTRAENWGDRSLKLVNELSDETLHLITGEEDMVETTVPTIVDELAMRAA